jgi:hypothetical protein
MPMTTDEAKTETMERSPERLREELGRKVAEKGLRGLSDEELMT